MENVYHIYLRGECIYHSLKEDEFKKTWSTLKNMVGLMKTDYCETDLSFEKLTMNKKETLNSSY